MQLHIDRNTCLIVWRRKRRNGIILPCAERSIPKLGLGDHLLEHGRGCIPLLFVPLTESSGRMPGYFISYIILVAFIFGFAFSQNFATMLVTRFFGGGASSVSINIVGGTISDVWAGSKARSLPMSIFGFTSVIGIALGPFVGSAIQEINKPNAWRW